MSWLAALCIFLAGSTAGFLAAVFCFNRGYNRAVRLMYHLEAANATPPYTFIPAQPVQPDFSRFN